MASNIIGNEIRNTAPASGRPLAPVTLTPADGVRAVVERARRAQQTWASFDWDERRRRLLRFRDVLNDNADEMVELLSLETSKPRFEALTHEVLTIVDLTHYFATRAEKFLRDDTVHHHLLWPFKRGYRRYEPRGVIGIISPWNFPFAIPMGDVIMALAARNAAVVKPSEWTPHVMLKARELLAAAGIDPDLVGVVPGDGNTGAALVDAGVDMVVFTGSVATGRKVGAACGERLIPYTAELGGKDVAIVLPDVDIDRAARQIVHGAFLNSGQTCASIERVLVHESIFDVFLDQVVESTERLRQGDPLASHEHDVDVGGMVVPDQIATVERHIADARSKGARIVAGGHARYDGGGRFFEPTVLIDVTDDMACWTEETFGPTLPIRPYTDLDEAIDIANASEFGLNAYVFSGSPGRAEDVANRLQAGGVVVNDFFFHHGAPEVPWGGWKHSGLGRVHGGAEGLRHLNEIRYIGMPRSRLSLPVAFPYTAAKYQLFHRWVRRLFRGPWSRLV